MYRFLSLFLILNFLLPVFAARTVVTQEPYYYPPNTAYYGGDYVESRNYQRKTASVFPDINELEKYTFNRSYGRDNDRMRLERLEMAAFGAVQEGDFYGRYDNVRNAILLRPKQNYKTSLLRNIADYFSGQMTGFTPPITNNQYYSQPYGIKSVTQTSTPFGGGYSVQDYGIGTGSGVRILD